MTRQIIKNLESRLHAKVQVLETVQDTRGVLVQKIAIGSDLYALKIYFKNVEEGMTFRESSILNEIRILKTIDNHFNYYFDSEDNEDSIWILTHWIDGLNANEFLRKITNPAEHYSAIKKIVQRISQLHDLGYLHGDLQPKHIKITNHHTVELLDFGLSRKVKDSDQVYKGGLVHFNSPEVAKAMLEEKENIAYGLPSEIYTLGSVLFFCLTGYTSSDYGSNDYKNIPFKIKLKLISDGKRNSFQSAGYLHLPELEEILDSMLDTNPLNRPSNLKVVIKKFETLLANVS